MIENENLIRYEGDQVVRVGGFLLNLRFLLKLEFIRKYPDGPRKRFNSLTKIWSSKEPLPPALFHLMHEFCCTFLEFFL